MVNQIEGILSRGANSLDITPTMFKEATSHYKAVGVGREQRHQGRRIPLRVHHGNGSETYSENDDAYFDIDVLVDRTGHLPQSTPPEDRKNKLRMPCSTAIDTAE